MSGPALEPCDTGLGFGAHHQVHKGGAFLAQAAGRLRDDGQGGAVVTLLVRVGEAVAIAPLVFHIWCLSVEAPFHEAIAELPCQLGLGGLFVDLGLQWGRTKGKCGRTSQNSNRERAHACKALDFGEA